MKNFYRVYIMIFCSILVIIISSLVVVRFFNTLTEHIQEQIEITLHEIAVQNAKILETKINDSLNFLMHISEEIAPILISDRQKAMNFLVKSTQQMHFDNMAIVYPDGEGYNIDNIKLNVRDRGYFQASMKGEHLISNPIINRITGDKTSIFSVPIYHKDKIIAVLLTVYSVKKMNELLSNHSFEGRSYTYIVRSTGDIIVNSDYKTNSKIMENFFDTLQTSDNSSKAMAKILQKNIRAKEYGTMKFDNKINKYIYYYPTKINDWYVFIIIPINLADNILNLLLDQTINVSIINFGLYSALFIIILYFQFKSKKELIEIAYTDKLTGGDSFSKFCIDANNILKEYNVNISKNAAFLSINIDNFKAINNIFGHKEGNNAIRFIWETINNIKMHDELHTHHIADQFYALFYFETKKDLIDRLTYLYEALQNYNILEEKRYPIKISAGIYEINEKGLDINTIIDNANTALKTIKGNFNRFYAFFDETIRNKILNKSAIENQMIESVQNKEFIVYYQPRYDITEEKLSGAETTVKWIKKDGTLIPNSEFAELFEKNFFITTLDKYVFSAVCKKQKIWINSGLTTVPISISLSKLHFYNPNSIRDFKKTAEENGIETKNIIFELTADSVFENINFAKDYVAELRETGFAIIIKDFIIGHSSMLSLKNIETDMIKMNKNFIGNISEMLNRKIISNLVQLAHSFNIKVIMNDIENEDEYEFLKSIKCDIIQGRFLYSPVESKEFEKLLFDMQSYKKYK
ncbi:MAG: EAL domain-containing protein [Endomicrobiaceae bacterium]